MSPNSAGGAAKPNIRVAIIGLGAIAQTAHLPVLSKMRGVSVVALCDNDRAKARALAQRFNVESTYNDIDDLFETEELDAVVVATPNHAHEPHVLSALKAGLHVMCERPFALTGKGVERILAAAKKAGKMVFVANNHRFRLDAQALHSFIHGGELGKEHSVRAGAYRMPSATAPWRTRRAESGGGAFMQLGLPLLDLAGWLGNFPEPLRASATMNRARGAGTVEDSLFVFAELSNGFNVTIDVNWNYPGSEDRWWFEVLGTEGSARMAPLRVTKMLHGKPTDVSPTGALQRDTPLIQSYRAEFAHFIAVLRGEAEYEAPEDQILIYHSLEGIYEAAETGREFRA
jgi:predicted dehydrogenase